MKKVLDIYSSKNDDNIKQIVAYKDKIPEIDECRDGAMKDDTMNVMTNLFCEALIENDRERLPGWDIEC